MILLFKTTEYLRQELGNVFRTFLDNSNSSENGFLFYVCAIVTDTLQNLIVKLPRQLCRTNLTDHTKNQTYNTVVTACKINSQSVCSHH